ncbi:nuclear transport factor 2 family protein [Rhodococcoides yunnanense]|jgi:ketosteroid isomerase-like protein|uniref:nuclear transport factor 2 family protein n=1 Tax=Rhodococcoides yunnanense TaxID=278209 RepID=UPI0022B11DD3|nr:nuclear transport factor 2 family protein [Rhodococcus yunnanensis]MCZ4278482.1 nuclear transport factor 2 family protein [Rhodococcus yunnanensis]
MSDEKTGRADLEAIVRELADRQAILDCLMRYSRGVDRLDRDVLLSVYHDDAIDDHGMFVGGPIDFADWVIGMHRTLHISQQHCLFNHTCELDGDVAHTETYYMFVGMNRQGPPLAMSGGRYVDRFERRNGVWAIAHRVCLRDWIPVDETPDPADPFAFTAVKDGLPPAMAALMATASLSTRDKSDPSYARPFVVGPERIAEGTRLSDG